MLLTSFESGFTEAGCDEAGRGCFAGPVFAAAVILPPGFNDPLLNDSKKLTALQREKLAPVIKEYAISWCVTQISNEEIDATNILKASQKAMHLAIEGLKVTPGFLLIDGNYFIPYKNTPHRCIIKGDGKYTSIAAASILAKTHRDAFMQQLHDSWPQYGWNKNKGYGTAAHRKAIAQFGLCSYHRKSFNLLPQQMSIF